MEVATDVGHQITARKLMHIVLYDNGAVNRFEPDNIKKYPKRHFEEITKACELFFDAHPSLLTDDNLEEIAAGCQEDNDAKYNVYFGWAKLNEVLDNWFNSGI